jgi:hypothetical protein
MLCIAYALYSIAVYISSSGRLYEFTQTAACALFAALLHSMRLHAMRKDCTAIEVYTRHFDNAIAY